MLGITEEMCVSLMISHVPLLEKQLAMSGMYLSFFMEKMQKKLMLSWIVICIGMVKFTGATIVSHTAPLRPDTRK